MQRFKIIKIKSRNYLFLEEIHHYLDKSFFVLTFFIHHDIYPDYEANSDYFEDNIKINITSLITKLKHVCLGHPFSNCLENNNGINNSETPRWYIHCYRRCLLREAFAKFNCFMPFLDLTIHQLDQDNFKDFNVSNICKYQTYYNFEIIRRTTNINQMCRTRCPKQCVNVMYNQHNINSDTLADNTHWFNKSHNDRQCSKKLMWDTSQPGYAYIEEAKMTFTDYLVNFGGLLGLWCGLNIQIILINIIQYFLSNNMDYRYYTVSIIFAIN